jgi:hypothetical protein
MLKKVSIGKGVTVVLVISMFGMGAPSLPSAYASGVDNTQVSTQNEQKAPVNELSKLEIEGTTFDQTFSPELYQYTATVENNVQSITLHASSEDEKAAITISVNGQTVDDISKPIPLGTGDNQIAIKVDDGVNTANTYNLTITRKKSSNNLLQDLQLSDGELAPTFDASVTSYSVQVANNVNELTVTPVAADQTASILVNDTPVTDKGVPVQLSTGNTEISVLVTAENGDKKTYSIEVTKAVATSTGSDSSNAPTSSTATGSDSSNAPTSSTATGSGFSNVPSSSTTTGKGVSHSQTSSSGYNRPSNLSAANFSQSSNRSAGSFSVRSISSSSQMQGAQQGGTPVQQPSKATLSTLSVSAGTWNKTFTKDTYTYHIAVDNETDSITINTAPTYSGAAVTIQDGTTNTITLGNQKKTIVPIVVTNGDEHKTYILVFDKDVPDVTATSAASQPASSPDTTAADPAIKNTSVTPGTNNWNGRNYNNNNNGATSFWSRLIQSIRSFFSNL